MESSTLRGCLRVQAAALQVRGCSSGWTGSSCPSLYSIEQWWDNPPTPTWGRWLCPPALITHTHTHTWTSKTLCLYLRHQSQRSSCSLQPIWRWRDPVTMTPSPHSSHRTRGEGWGRASVDCNYFKQLTIETQRALSDLGVCTQRWWNSLCVGDDNKTSLNSDIWCKTGTEVSH